MTLNTSSLAERWGWNLCGSGLDHRCSGSEGQKEGWVPPSNPEPEGPGHGPRCLRGISWGAQRGRRGGGQVPPPAGVQIKPTQRGCQGEGARRESRHFWIAMCLHGAPPTRLHSVPAVHLRHADVPGGEGETLKSHRVPFPWLPYK